MAHYPLERVQELHLSGGSWSVAEGRRGVDRIRRDTHDGAVPEEVFDLLKIALRRCSNIKAVIFERLGDTLTREQDINDFREDFRRIKQIVKGHHG